MANKNNSVITRYRLFGLVFILVVIAVFFSVLHTMFIDGDRWRSIAKTINRPTYDSVAPMRGNIISSDGHIIALSKPIYRLYFDPKGYGLPDMDRDSLYKQLDSLAYQMSLWQKGDRATYSELRKRLRSAIKGRSRYALMIPYDVDYTEYQKLKDRYPLTITKVVKGRPRKLHSTLYKCIKTEQRAARYMPYGNLAARTIGGLYKEVDGNLTRGMYGLEQGCDSLLRGEPGLSKRQSYGDLLSTTNTIQDPINGCNVYTTLDMNLQQIVDRALRDQLTKFQAAMGGAVLMEVKTGRIVAISNLEQRGNSYMEGTNFSLSSLNEPGSTFKTPFMMAALEDGVAEAGDTIDTGNGVFPFGGYTIKDHNAHRGGYGRISVAQGLWYSSNIVMAKLAIKGYQSNPQKLYDHLRHYGMMDQLDMEIPGVGRPTFLLPEHPRFGTSTIAAISRGYSVQLPAINTLNFYNGIANGGQIMKPHLVDRVETVSGQLVYKTEPRVLHKDICSQRTLDTIRQMLDDVVLRGTGRVVRSDMVSISGKTGTALMANMGNKGYRSGGNIYMTSFCGYFPSDEPQYSCIVFIINPKGPGSNSGGLVAGVVMKRIAEEIWSQSNPLLIDTISTPQDNALWALNVDIAGGRYGTVYRYLNQYKLPIAPPREGQAADIKKDQLVTVRRSKEGFTLTPTHKCTQGVMPSLVGLAPDEALYQLALAGGIGQLSGYGRVIGQSIPVGTKIAKGQRILLTLGTNTSR